MAGIIVKAFGIQDNVFKLLDIALLSWRVNDGDPVNGCTNLNQTASMTTTNSIDEYVLLEFEKSGTETPTSVELTSFKRKCAAFTTLANATIEIMLVQPDATEISLKGPITITATDSVFVQEGALTLTASDFSQAGVYKIYIKMKVDITAMSGTFELLYDDIQVTIDTTSIITGKSLGIQDNAFHNSPIDSSLSWNTAEGDPTVGCTEIDITLMTGSDTAEYILLKFNKTGTVGDQVIPSFKRKCLTRDSLTTSTIEIFLKQPDATLVSLKGPISITTADGSFVQEGPIAISAAQMSQDGEYAILVRQISVV